MNSEDNEFSFGKSNKSRRHRGRSNRHTRILEETESSFKGNESRLQIDEDKERMILNPGKSLKSTSKDLPRYYRSAYLYSMAFYVMAYGIVYLPGKIASAFLASLSMRGPVIFHHKILFTNIVGWERSDALSIFSAPIVIDFFQSILYTSAFWGLKRLDGYWKILAFWLMFHSYLRLTGLILPGMVSGEEFGYVAGWLYMSSAILFVLFFLSMLVMIGLSALLGKWALETAFSKHMVMKKKRQEYLLFFIGLPSLSGFIFFGFLHGLDWTELLTTGRMPLADWWASVHEMTLIGESMLMYGAMATTILLYREQEIICQRDLRMQNVNIPVIGIAFVTTLALRVLLGQGWYW